MILDGYSTNQTFVMQGLTEDFSCTPLCGPKFDPRTQNTFTHVKSFAFVMTFGHETFAFKKVTTKS